MESISDITQAFIAKKYLLPDGPADILLNPHNLSKFLKKHRLLKYFVKQGNLKVASFRDADPASSEPESPTIEFMDGKILKNASIHVMFDSFFREEHLCPVRIAHNNGRYELLLAPMSQENISRLDHFYASYKINIVHAYHVRQNELNLPFKSSDLPDCLAAMFIDQNAVYEEEDSREGITVSDEHLDPDATIMNIPAEDLMKLYKKE